MSGVFQFSLDPEFDEKNQGYEDRAFLKGLCVCEYLGIAVYQHVNLSEVSTTIKWDFKSYYFEFSTAAQTLVALSSSTEESI